MDHNGLLLQIIEADGEKFIDNTNESRAAPHYGCHSTRKRATEPEFDFCRYPSLDQFSPISFPE
jgi:hypothetical protein